MCVKIIGLFCCMRCISGNKYWHKGLGIFFLIFVNILLREIKAQPQCTYTINIYKK